MINDIDSAWDNLLCTLFDNEIPVQKEWNSFDDILNILIKISECSYGCNQLRIPITDCTSITEVKPSLEKNCIEILTDSLPHIIKPKKLIFYGNWNYFEIEVLSLEKLNFEDGINDYYHRVFERNPLEYETEVSVEEFEENGIPLPGKSRVIDRVFRGPLLIIKKGQMKLFEFEKFIYNKYNGEIQF